MSLATLEQYTDAKIVLASVNDGLYTNEQMQAFLDYATEFIESQCYQQLELSAVEEIFQVGSLYCNIDAAKQLNIFLKRGPVTSVSSLTYRTLPSAAWTTISTDLWSYTTDQNKITLPYSIPLQAGKWGQIKANYSAGYSITTMPKDLSFACILVAAHFASMGYAAIDIRSGMIRQVLPRDAMRIVDDTINRYQRQF